MMEEYFDTNVVGQDNTKVDNWCVIKQLISDDVDGNDQLFTEMKNLSKPQLGQNIDIITKCSEFFERLENNFQDEFDVIDFLINLATYMQHHLDLGTIKLEELLKKHRTMLEEFREKCYKEGLYTDKYFVGRKDYIKHVEQILMDEKEVGFCICGMGGVGKTSVAREICINLWKKKKRWTPKKIDLREVRYLKDLLKDTLVRLGEKYEENDTDMLTQQLFTFLKNNLHDQTILLFDNIDDPLEHDHLAVEHFIIQLVRLLNEMESHCKIRILITSRTKLQPFTNQLKLSLPEKELVSLSETDAIDLLKKCTKGIVITKDQEKDIVSLCGCNPLALRNLSSSLKNRLTSPRQLILNLQHKIHTTCLTDVLNVKQCIQQTFSSMDKTLQNCLIQLSVFRTTLFDLRAASAILKLQEEATSLHILCLKSRHLIEVFDKYTELKFFGGDGPSISLHPIVYTFLREEVEKRENLTSILAMAELNYVEYYDKIAMECGKKKQRNFTKFQTMFEKHRPYLQIFFDYLISFKDNTSKLQAIQCINGIDSWSRLSDLISYMMDDREMINFAEKYADKIFKRNDTIQGVFWKIEQGILFLEEERINESFEVIEDIKQFINKFKKSEIDQTNAKLLGRFYYLKGRLYVYKKLTDKAFKYYNKSILYYEMCSDKQIIFSELAEVYNCKGAAYFKTDPPNLQTAKLNHEKALEILTRNCKGNHPEKANYMTNIASCLNWEANEMITKREEASPKLRIALQLATDSLKLDEIMQRHVTKAKDYAMKLVMRANIYQNLEDFDKSLEDQEKALAIRKSIFETPHDLITISTHRIGYAKQRKARQIYRNNKKLALVLFREALEYYDKALTMIKMGGLSKDKETEYIMIRDTHIELLSILGESDQQRSQIEREYIEYECGTFKEQARKYKEMSTSKGERMSYERAKNLSSSSDDGIMSSSTSSQSPATSEESSVSDSEYNLNTINQIASTGTDVITGIESKTENINFSNFCQTNDFSHVSEKTTENVNVRTEASIHQIPESLDIRNNDKRQVSGMSTGSEDVFDVLNRSLSYQSSLDEVFTTEITGTTRQSSAFNQQRVDSGYSSVNSISSTSCTSHDGKKTAIKRASSLQQSTSSNKGLKHQFKRSKSHLTPLIDFVDKICNKSTKPKLSKGLLGDSFDEVEET